MVEIEDIPNIPDQRERIREVTVDCYGQSEELAAMEVYLMEAIHYPFEATWQDPDEPGQAEPVTVLGFGTTDERRGIKLEVQRGNKKRQILAEQLWAKAEDSANAIVLNDYRYWVNDLHGLTPGFS
jgi:calcium binding protein